MLDMATKNAAQMLTERQLKRELKRDRIPQSVYALQRDLQLAAPPRHIEGIDISTFQGEHPVGSVVCFIDGRAKRSPVPLLQNPRPRPARRLRCHPPSGPSPLPRPSRAQRATARPAAH